MIFAPLITHATFFPFSSSRSFTAAAIEAAPFGTRRIELDGRPIELAKFMSNVWIDDEYFQTLGLTVSRGRSFTPDDRAGAPPVGVITASLARELVGAGNAIGRRLGFDSFQEGRVTLDIVGIVPDFVKSVGVDPLRVYRPAAQQPVVPTYPGGGIGFMYVSDTPWENGLSTPMPPGVNNYINPEVHRAAFALPEFFRRELYGRSDWQSDL